MQSSTQPAERKRPDATIRAATKADVGTGLGLWVTKEIITRHGGTIEVVSQAEAGLPGARFAVEIPC